MDGLDKPGLLAALRENGIRLNQAGEDLFNDQRFQPDRRPRVLEVTAMSVAELGFPDGSTYGSIVTRALASGLCECPLELGPYLRLQFTSQPEVPEDPPPKRKGAPRGAVTIASPPLEPLDATPKGFYLRHVGGVLWLRGYWSGHDHVWAPEDVLVFSPIGQEIAR